jgi:hypothetical protein
MADLSDIQSAGITKITGSDAAGVEQTPVQSTASGALHTNIRSASGNEAVVKNVEPLSTDYGLVVRTTPDSSIIVKQDTKHTYYASIAFTFAATPTDIINLKGSATKKIVIHRILLEATQTNDAFRPISLIKRSTANSAGTVVTPIPSDSTFPAATAIFQYYTANPTTLGTAVGALTTQLSYIPKSNGIIADSFEIDYTEDSESAIVLNNENESISLNMNGVSSTGNSTYVTIVWTEE